MEHPKIIQELVEDFIKLPSIGRKTALRLAYSCLHLSSEELKKFSNDLASIKEKIHVCPICHNLYENDVCPICFDQTRDKQTLMVISDSKNIMQFENTNQYFGQYFCLDGLINPSVGNLPSTIGVDKLLKHIKKNSFKEIIFAFSPDITGEITTMYITKLLKANKIDVKLSRLAYGIPINSQLEYLDEETLSSSLRQRIQIKTESNQSGLSTFSKEENDEF